MKLAGLVLYFLHYHCMIDDQQMFEHGSEPQDRRWRRRHIFLCRTCRGYSTRLHLAAATGTGHDYNMAEHGGGRDRDQSDRMIRGLELFEDVGRRSRPPSLNPSHGRVYPVPKHGIRECGNDD